MKKLILLALAVIVGLCYSLPASAAEMQGDKKFEVNGEVRIRGDYADNPTDLNDDTDDSGLVWPWRVRAGIHGSFARNVSAHVEFQSFGYGGDGLNGIQPEAGTSFLGDTGVYQGYLDLGDIGGTSFDLRLGRQELVFGKEMLLGDLDFYNGINHDGARAGWQYKGWSLDVFYSDVVESATVPFFSPGNIFPTSSPADDTTLYGAYAVFKPKNIGFDAYMLLFNNNFDDTGTPAPMEERWTYGGRVYNKRDSNWGWWAEFALQTGEFESALDLDPSTAGIQNTLDISAMGLEAELSYQFRKAKIKPRVHGRYSTFTGEDDDASDSEAFNPLFQDYHGRYGKFDLFRASNLDVLEVGVSWYGKEDRHVFGANYLMFTANEEQDVDPGIAEQMEDDLGTELDLYYKYAYTKNLDIMAAIASFSPGDLLEAGATAGNSPDLSLTPGTIADDSAMRIYVNTRLRW